MNAISTTDLLDTFTKTLCVEYDNVALSFNFSGDSLGTCSALAINPINNLSGGIRVNNPILNNNIGKFNLPHIWDRILLNTKSLNLKKKINNNSTQSN